MIAVFVGVDEVAVKQVARHFIVVADIVETHDAGVGAGKLRPNSRGKFRLGHTFFIALLRRDAGKQYRFGRGQIVVGLFAIEYDGVGDGVEIGVGADAGELSGAVGGGADAEGFVVVDEEGGRVLGHGVVFWIVDGWAA